MAAAHPWPYIAGAPTVVLDSQPQGDKMSSKFIAGALAAVALSCAGPALSQQPNPLDNVPEALPANVPYGAPISLERADAALAAAVAESKAKGWPMVCAVVDSGANLVSFKRMDGAQIASVSIAQHKARASAKFRRETKVFEAGVQGGNNYLLGFIQDDFVASRGGIPILDGGKLIGAIGCSGGTGSQDEVVAKAGVAAAK
jgi:glc operon protein GlcG